jgi:putative dimethyl sulfoxide reductase chaperone
MRSAQSGVRNEEWAARPAKPPRSVFRNYGGTREDAASAEIWKLTDGRDPTAMTSALLSVLPLPKGEGRGEGEQTVRTHPCGETLQAAIDAAMSRLCLYRFLAKAYEDPTPEGWSALASTDCQQCFGGAVRILAATAPALAAAAGAFQPQLKPETFESFLASYLAAFGHAARGRCPLNEIEYGDIKADPLFQPHRLADLAGFYHAFGLEVAADAGERHDHICLELEFMCVLAAKEAYALEQQLDPEDLSLCRDAQKQFLREHLGRWTPAFARRLGRMAADTALGALANLTCAFVEAECARYGITPGSEDLLLRPVDETAESMCNSCGVTQLPPGALAQP